MLKEEQEAISADLAMIRGTLKEIVDLLRMMENLKIVRVRQNI